MYRLKVLFATVMATSVFGMSHASASTTQANVLKGSTNNHLILYQLVLKKHSYAANGFYHDSVNGHLIQVKGHDWHNRFTRVNLTKYNDVLTSDVQQQKVSNIIMDDAQATVYQNKRRLNPSRFFDKKLTVKNISGDQVYFTVGRDRNWYHTTDYNVKVYRNQSNPVKRINHHPMSRHQGYVYYRYDNTTKAHHESFQRAVNTWNRSGAKLRETNNPKLAKLLITAGNYHQNAWSGLTTFSISRHEVSGKIQFDTSHISGGSNGLAYQNIAMHELGHALGLDHNMIGTTMGPNYRSDYQATGVSWVDKLNLDTSIRETKSY